MARRRRASGVELRRVPVLRRVAVTVVAGGLLVAGQIAATLNPAGVHESMRQHPTAMVRPKYPRPEPGEPELSSDSSVPSPARSAAVTFVRDYARWNSRRAVTMPGRDMKARVLGLLEHRGRLGAVDITSVVASVRIARAPRGAYVVTSAIGNFLVGRQRTRWLVISLPGD